MLLTEIYCTLIIFISDALRKIQQNRITPLHYTPKLILKEITKIILNPIATNCKHCKKIHVFYFEVISLNFTSNHTLVFLISMVIPTLLHTHTMYPWYTENDKHWRENFLSPSRLSIEELSTYKINYNKYISFSMQYFKIINNI